MHSLAEATKYPLSTCVIAHYLTSDCKCDSGSHRRTLKRFLMVSMLSSVRPLVAAHEALNHDLLWAVEEQDEVGLGDHLHRVHILYQLMSLCSEGCGVAYGQMTCWASSWELHLLLEG